MADPNSVHGSSREVNVSECTFQLHAEIQKVDRSAITFRPSLKSVKAAGLESSIWPTCSSNSLFFDFMVVAPVLRNLG